MAEVILTSDNFEEEVLNYQGLTLVDFWASWCGPCKMLSPVLSEIAQENPDIKVCKVNVDEQMELAIKYQVSSIPLVLLFKDGQVINQHLGYAPKEQIEELWK